MKKYGRKVCESLHFNAVVAACLILFLLLSSFSSIVQRETQCSYVKMKLPAVSALFQDCTLSPRHCLEVKLRGLEAIP